jgi:phytoene dehydrogenase-like protein
MTAAFGLVLGSYAHAVGWPMVRGGTVAIADALGAEVRRLGGGIVTGVRIGSLTDLPESRVVILDTTPRAAVEIAGDRLPAQDAAAVRGLPIWPRRLQGRLGAVRAGAMDRRGRRTRRDGPPRRDDGRTPPVGAPGRDGPAAGSPVHAVRAVRGVGPTRAPAGQHTAWAYCHVPAGSTVDMTERIEHRSSAWRRLPGSHPGRATHGRRARAARSELRRRRHQRGGLRHPPARLPADTRARPVSRRRGTLPVLVIDPTGGGVHGMGGYLAARSALRRDLR